MRKELLSFFFGLLAFSLLFAFINSVGFHVEPINNLTIWETGVAVIILAGIATCVAVLIDKSRRS